MKQSTSKPGSFPYHVFGISLFFLAHGYSENVGLIPFSEMLVFFLGASVVSILLLLFLTKKMRSVIKAGLVTTIILSFYLFFGAIQDRLKHSNTLFSLSKYSILIPVFLVLTIIVYFLIKKSSKDFSKINNYANALLLALLLFDFTSITKQFFGNKTLDDKNAEAISNSLSKCDTCSKPDIYLIVLDEYWGNRSLKNYFHYDNNRFTTFLKQKGFFVATDPSSNYACTPVSMASMMSMKYMDWLNGHKDPDVVDYALGAKIIRNNNVVRFLKSEGYEIKNYSIFDMDGKNAVFDVSDLPIKLRLITAKTLWSRVVKDLSWNLIVKAPEKSTWFAQMFNKEYKDGNTKVIDLMDKEIAIDKIEKPRFIYGHLLMPHYPYIYDSTGKEQFEYSYFNPNLPRKKDDSCYLQYLVYTNNKIKDLVNLIFEKGKKNSAVIIMSDHGNRHFESTDKSVSANNNFNAVFLPQKNYSLFYDSVSNVNQFRIIFNSLFDQHLPVLKDSVVF